MNSLFFGSGNSLNKYPPISARQSQKADLILAFGYLSRRAKFDGFKKSTQKEVANFCVLLTSISVDWFSDSTKEVRYLATLLMKRNACKTTEGSESRRLQSKSFLTSPACLMKVHRLTSQVWLSVASTGTDGLNRRTK